MTTVATAPQFTPSAVQTWAALGFVRIRRPRPATAGQTAPWDAAFAHLGGERWAPSLFDGPGGAPWRPLVYDTSAFSDVDAIVCVETTDLARAIAGVDRLEATSWSECFETEWIFGRREFEPIGPLDPAAPVGFIALWQWTDEWAAMSPAARREYDDQCDIAFAEDINLGIAISGRHRCDLNSTWHHFAIWHAADIEKVNLAMANHEAVADFRLTLSRHFIGSITPFEEFLRRHDV